MPNYRYRDERTGDEYDVQCSISEWDKLLESHPYYKWIPVSGLPTIDPVRLGRMKPDNTFTDKLKEIKRANPGSSMNTWNRGEL